MTGELQLFCLNASRGFGEGIAAALGVRLAAQEERSFEDGEHKTRPCESVRGRDVFVVQALYGGPEESVNDKLCRLLFFIGALRDASAARITAVIPYLCYARKERKTKPRDPVTTRYLAQILEAVGVEQVVSLDVHSAAAFQNAFRCRSELLEARLLFVKYFAPLLRGREVTVLSPDAGGVKRADAFRRALVPVLGREVSLGLMEKYRSAGEVSGSSLFADVDGRVVVIVDDLVSTGGTFLRAAEAARRAGATAVYAAATHGLFIDGAARLIASPAIDRVIVTNSVVPFRVDLRRAADKLVILDACPLFAEAVRRLHEGGSIVDLLGPSE